MYKKLKKMDKKKIIVIIEGLPSPKIGASAVIFYWYIKALKKAGYDLLCLVITKKEIEFKELEQISKSIDEIEGIKIQTIISKKSIIYNPILGPKKIDSNLALEVSKNINLFKPEVIICFDLIAAWSATEIKFVKKLVWLGDLNFETYWHHIFYSLERKDYKNALLNFLYFRPWKKIYKNVLEGCSKIIVCSKSSERQMKMLGIESEYLPYPWPTEKLINRKPGSIPTIAFYGSLSGLGSLSAVRILIKEIYPKLVNKFGKKGFVIKIFGSGKLPDFAQIIVEKNKEFEFLGYVDDIRIELAECHALIAPIEVPVGNRTRIITALSYGLPVIAHENTALGNPDLLSGINCLLGKTASEFTNHFFKIYAEPEYASEISKNGMNLYIEKFLPHNASRLFIDKLVSIQY